jgi:hypothetical protein
MGIPVALTWAKLAEEGSQMEITACQLRWLYGVGHRPGSYTSTVCPAAAKINSKIYHPILFFAKGFLIVPKKRGGWQEISNSDKVTLPTLEVLHNVQIAFEKAGISEEL